MLQYRIDCGKPGANDVFKANGRNQGKVAKLTNAGDSLVGAHPLGKKGCKDIGFFVSCERYHHVHVLDVFLLK